MLCDTQTEDVQTQGNKGEGHSQCDTQVHIATPNENGTGVQRPGDTQPSDDARPDIPDPADTPLYELRFGGKETQVDVYGVKDHPWIETDEVQQANDSALPMTDARPDPKPRKHPQLWQAYLWWFELMEMRKRHLLRISSIERGKSNLSADFERAMLILTNLDELVDPKNKGQRERSVKQQMIDYGQEVGPIWDWCLSIKGLGEGLTAQLLAQIDDIDNSPTVSALWRFAGFAVGDDGKAEKNQKGVKSPFNRKLKGICYNIADQFIRQQTPGYIDIYYAEKKRLRENFTKAMCRECGDTCISKQKKVKGESVDVWRCENNGKHTLNYTDAHLHNMAWRKMIKAFLKDLWIEWKRSEG